jgi:hypothetical protein
MRIRTVQPQANWVLSVVAEDGRIGVFDLKPYLHYEAFAALQQPSEFAKVTNGSYFVEWACGADLSADTIEARWEEVAHDSRPASAARSQPALAAAAAGSAAR